MKKNNKQNCAPSCCCRGTPHGKKKHIHKHNQKWYTHMSWLTQPMPPPEKYRHEIGSQPTTCQVYTTGTYVSLLAPGRARQHPLPPRKYYHENILKQILHVVPITTHTHVRPKSIGKERKEKKRKEIETGKDRGKKRKDEKRKQGKEKKQTKTQYY